MRSRWLEDVRAVMDRDPAVRSMLEVLWCYPGVHALWMHRMAHSLYRSRLFLLARVVSAWSRFLTGIDIHPGAQIGPRVFIDHGTGIVIGETAVVGADVTMYQGVTLGSTGKETGKRHPTVGDRVMLSAGSILLGNITVGDDVKVGAGTVLLRSVPNGATVVGVPGRVVAIHGESVGKEDAKPMDDRPPAWADAIELLESRLEAAETRLRALEQQRPEQEEETRGPTHRLA